MCSPDRKSHHRPSSSKKHTAVGETSNSSNDIPPHSRERDNQLYSYLSQSQDENANGDTVILTSFSKSQDEDDVLRITPSQLHRRSRTPSGKSNSMKDVFDKEEDSTKSRRRTQMLDSKQESTDLVLFGMDLSHLSPNFQFYVCACGVFSFTLVYGYLQELIAVHITGRKYTIFFSSCQFLGYAFWSFILTMLDRLRCYMKQKRAQEEASLSDSSPSLVLVSTASMSPVSMVNRNEGPESTSGSLTTESITDDESIVYEPTSNNTDSTILELKQSVESNTHRWNLLKLYLVLSLIRATDVGMTNAAMRYLNYPMKTLIKSSRVMFTMIGGIVIGKRTYSKQDYWMVGLLVTGLSLFINADMHSKTAVFHPLGLAMLTISLICDGAVANFSELIMVNHRTTQDEFQLVIYSISFVAMLVATIISGEFTTGFKHFFLQHGTIPQIQSIADGSEEDNVIFWTIGRKIMVLTLFTLTGLCGSSCAGAITKRFGALSMSITSTTRKAFTLFISFIAFKNNRCTPMHLVGMMIFIIALFLKSVNVDTLLFYIQRYGPFRYTKVSNYDNRDLQDLDDDCFTDSYSFDLEDGRKSKLREFW